MYTRDSRYRNQHEILRTDATGRELVVTALRRPPERTGAYRHLVEDGDRLDHLSQRYYRRPHRWWEICDANPGVLSPLRLIGQEPLRTLRVTVPDAVPPDPPLPWHAALADLRSRAGVGQVALTTEDIPGPAGTITAGVITVGFNRLSVPEADLIGAVIAHGLTPLRTSVAAGAVGGQIVVPPPSARP